MVVIPYCGRPCKSDLMNRGSICLWGKHAKLQRSQRQSCAISAAALHAHTVPPHTLHPSIHCNNLTGHVSVWVRQSQRVNRCMRTVQAKSSTVKGPDKITEKRMGHCSCTKSAAEEWGSGHGDSNWTDRNVTGGSVRLASVDAAHASPIHNAGTRIAIKRNFATALVLNPEWMMTALNHFWEMNGNGRTTRSQCSRTVSNMSSMTDVERVTEMTLRSVPVSGC